MLFFDRELCSKVLKEALLLFLLFLAWNQKQKNVPNGTENVPNPNGTKNVCNGIKKNRNGTKKCT